MQSLKELKRRIGSIGSTMKITRAMKLIAASKLRREQERTVNSRKYKELMKEIALQSIYKGKEIDHPAFLLRKKTKRAKVVVIATEGGFCGPLNDNMARQMEQFLGIMRDREINTSIMLVGKKGAKVFQKFHIPFEKLDLDLKKPDEISDLCKRLYDMFLSEETDRIMMAYSRFSSTISQPVTLDMFLPIWVKDALLPKFDDMVDFIFEPGKKSVIDYAVSKTLEAAFYQAVCEARTSELASRMVAMDKALNNAQDMLKILDREYNRARQNAITEELLDIIGGAEALRNA